MTQTYKLVDLEEGTPVQYLGVYALKWRPEMGEPTVGFVEVEEEAPRWIPVSERLPEEGVPVMVYSKLFGVSPRVCVVTGKKWLFYKAFSSRIMKEDSVSSALITHWMHQPTPPEEAING